METKKKLCILVAEDDYLVSEEIKHSLNEAGFNDILDASDGLQAVEVTCAHRPDVVLMDIHMPHLDGIEAAGRIHELCPTPVVVLTAFESEELVRRASASGISAYLTKPASSREIERAIIIAMARHGDLMELQALNRKIEAQKNELEKAMSEIKILRGILPICSFCKKIRDDKGYWEQVEVYMTKHSELLFSHGICPQCMQKHYSEYLTKENQ